MRASLLVLLGAASAVLATADKRLHVLDFGGRIARPRRTNRETAASSSLKTHSSSSSSASKPDQIRSVFRTAWEGYYAHAFPNDELQPVNNSFTNDFQGWGVTLVDASTTAVLMGLGDIVAKSLDFIPTIDYTRGRDDAPASLFETNIRHLGGLLSLYDLLSQGGPYANLVANRTQDVQAVLAQAQTLADTLKFAFDTPTGIPYNGLWLNNRSVDGDVINNVAQVGTLVLEWTRLSDLTGSPEYTELAQRAEAYLLDPVNPELGEPFPGLVGQLLNLTTGAFTSGIGGWIGGIDSYYEYLIKMYVYDPTRFASYAAAWTAAADSAMAHLTSSPTSRPELVFQGIHNRTRILTTSQYLAGFTGGNMILGGLALNDSRYVDYGLSLMDGYAAQYNQTATGLGPALFAWNPVDNGTQAALRPVPANQSAFYDRAGFWIREPSYSITPELVESWYHAYRVTGEQKYQDYVWDAFVALRDVTTVGSGLSAISNVNLAGGGQFLNSMPSFALAETLKYMYLTFAPEVPVGIEPVAGVDGQQWVFNTEAHPLRVLR